MPSGQDSMQGYIGTIKIFLYLAHSNCSLYRENRSVIDDELAACDLTTASLEAEIHNPRLSISERESCLSTYRTFKQFKRSLLSPIRTLPDELLAHIFTFVYDGYVDIYQFAVDKIWDRVYFAREDNTHSRRHFPSGTFVFEEFRNSSARNFFGTFWGWNISYVHNEDIANIAIAGNRFQHPYPF
ncbi:hypothetical protein BDQ17DRAFT_1434823 [Cyathus striatus]|nr:hypothetical protein BDQ17DRAFT_1434823 [Cyathus striatus]